MAEFKEFLERQHEAARLSGFQNLMQRRVREILLVSSPYDSFVLAEDGKLHELILSEFLEHNLSYAPGITRVSSGREALELARDQRRFNLIISTMHIDDLPVHQFARSVRDTGIETPFVLLTYDNRELADLLRRPEASVVDRVFNWQGDFRIFLTIVKHIEDRMIVEADFKDLRVEPSQGSHFFQNLTSFQVGYFTVNDAVGEGFVDWRWLLAQPTVSRRGSTRHVHLDEPLVVKMNGRTHQGVIYKPGRGG